MNQLIEECFEFDKDRVIVFIYFVKCMQNCKGKNIWSHLWRLKIAECHIAKTKLTYTNHTKYVETKLGKWRWLRTSAGMDKEVSCHQSCGIRDCFPRVKWLESEVDHLPYSSAEVKNVWRNSSAHSMHGDNFTFNLPLHVGDHLSQRQV